MINQSEVFKSHIEHIDKLIDVYNEALKSLEQESRDNFNTIKKTKKDVQIKTLHNLKKSLIAENNFNNLNYKTEKALNDAANMVVRLNISKGDSMNDMDDMKQRYKDLARSGFGNRLNKLLTDMEKWWKNKQKNGLTKTVYSFNKKSTNPGGPSIYNLFQKKEGNSGVGKSSYRREKEKADENNKILQKTDVKTLYEYCTRTEIKQAELEHQQTSQNSLAKCVFKLLESSIVQYLHTKIKEHLLLQREENHLNSVNNR